MAPPNLDRRKRVVSSAGGRLPDPGQQQRPQAPQQPGPVGPQQAPDGGIRQMANEQYRNALLRRQQGNIRPPQEAQADLEANSAGALQNMLRTRTSRRVLGGRRS